MLRKIIRLMLICPPIAISLAASIVHFRFLIGDGGDALRNNLSFLSAAAMFYVLNVNITIVWSRLAHKTAVVCIRMLTGRVQ